MEATKEFFLNDWLRAKQFPWQFFNDQTPAIDHGPLRVQTALFD
jgi:hypothetical protein